MSRAPGPTGHASAGRHAALAVLFWLPLVSRPTAPRAAATGAPRCSVAWPDSTGRRSRDNPPPSPAALVASAEVILVASPESIVPGAVQQSPLEPPTVLAFRVLEVLKGGARDSVVLLPGYFIELDEFNPGPVPYRSPRPSALRGSCFTFEYRRDALYLLLLVRDPDHGALTTTWAPLLPVNEQVRGRDDAWVAWVRAQVRTGR